LVSAGRRTDTLTDFKDQTSTAVAGGDVAIGLGLISSDVAAADSLLSAQKQLFKNKVEVFRGLVARQGRWSVNEMVKEATDLLPAARWLLNHDILALALCDGRSYDYDNVDNSAATATTAFKTDGRRMAVDREPLGAAKNEMNNAEAHNNPCLCFVPRKPIDILSMDLVCTVCALCICMCVCVCTVCVCVHHLSKNILPCLCSPPLLF
jgi:hypothetical protein